MFTLRCRIRRKHSKKMRKLPKTPTRITAPWLRSRARRVLLYHPFSSHQCRCLSSPRHRPHWWEIYIHMSWGVHSVSIIFWSSSLSSTKHQIWLPIHFQASGAECTRGCAFSPDGLCVLLNSDDNKIRLYELPKEDEVELIGDFIGLKSFRVSNGQPHRSDFWDRFAKRPVKIS